MRVVREALLATGCNKNNLKQWQRKYDKFMKQLPQVTEQYQRARTRTARVEELAQRMEKKLVQTQPLGREEQREFSEAMKELKRLQNSFDHELLVSHEDKELHSTYDSIISLGEGALKDQAKRLILQSEIENLLSLLKENLMKDRPDLKALCYFYQEHTDRELVDLPPAERLARISQVYKAEFCRPIEELLLIAIPQADGEMEKLLKRSDRRSRSAAEQLGILWNRPGEQRPPAERAEWLIGEILR